MSVIKLQEEELQELRDIETKNNQIIVGLGVLDLDIESLREKRNKLREDFKNLKIRQGKSGEDLQEKYGEGNINLETGEFTAIE